MNRNTVISNGTIFGLWLVDRTVFWVINVGLALGALYAASWLVLPRIMHRLPAWFALLLAGIAGAMLMAPAGYLVEKVLPDTLQAAPDNDWLDRFEQLGVWQGIVAEFLEVAPRILAVWMAINLPFFTSKPSLDGPAGPVGGTDKRQPVDVEKKEAGRFAEEARAAFLGEIPESLGTNVLAISSHLHYLHVHTDLGHCMILGSLQRAADAMGEEGMRVHRAHWVARSAIVKIIKDGQQWYCLLTKDLKVPISRRKKSTVAGWFGHSTKIVAVKSAKRGAA